MYGDVGVNAASQDSITSALRILCREKYDVQSVSADVISAAPWEKFTRLVVMPSSDAATTQSLLNSSHGTHSAMSRLISYVRQGGAMLVFGTSQACFDMPATRQVFKEAPGQITACVSMVDAGNVLYEIQAEPELARVHFLMQCVGIETDLTHEVPQCTPLFVVSRSRPLLDAFAAKLQSQAQLKEWSGMPNGAVCIPDTSDTWILLDSARYATDARTINAAQPAQPLTQMVLVHDEHLADVHDATRDFDLTQYFNALADARATSSLLPWRQPRSFHFAAGDIVAYARVIKSTQTVLDSNAHLLASCRPGMTFFATQQVQGRGRGKNVWISPRGCLQFSTLVPLPLHIGSKAVFLQYLAALAVVYGVGAMYPNVQGRVRIKWPNDLYAQVPAPQHGSVCVREKGADKHYVKIGGILVTAVCKDNFFHAVVGCGVNCLNSQPTTCLSSLANDSLSQEGCAGAIMAALESLIRVFADADYTFTPFADAYREAWLHSDQDVQLNDVAGESHRRIVGITSDYGLLRTVPVTSSIRASDPRAWSSVPMSGVVDVQPDGNSFDMLQGLLRKKT